MNPFRLIVDAFAASEFGEGPSYAEITVDHAFIERLVRLSRVCFDNSLESVAVAEAPERWGNEEDLRIHGSSLRVWGDDFWFEAHPKYADYNVETRGMSVVTLKNIAEAGADADAPDDCFKWSNGTLYFTGNPDSVSDLIDMIEDKEAEPGCCCSECGDTNTEAH